MTKKTLLITSGIIALSLLNVSNVQAEEESTIATEETTSNVLTDNIENEQENIYQLSDEEETTFNNIIRELEDLLEYEQNEILHNIFSEKNQKSLLIKEAIIAHESGDFDQANAFYNEIIEILNKENNDKGKNLVELFNELAKGNLSLLDFEYHQEISSQDLDEEDKAEEEKQAEPEEVDENEETSTASEQDDPQENKPLNAKKTEQTANELYNRILEAKTVTEAWNLAQEFKENFPDDDLLSKAMNQAAQLNLDYGMKIHRRGEIENAISYYNKIVNEEKVSSTLRSTAQAYLNQANANKELTTPKDYYNQILEAKTVTGAWNLAQEFKTSFPNSDLLSEALDYAAQLSLDYGMKIHKNGAYSDAALYYNKIVNEEKVSSTLRSTAQVYLKQANAKKDLTGPKDYYNKILKAKTVTEAWNLAQEFKTNFPEDDLLGEALNYAAQLSLNYGMKIHKNGAYSDAASYYNKIINEEKVSSTLRSTAQVYLNQANEGKELTTPKDYYGKVLASKKVSQAWSLAQEFKENFPGNVLLAEAFNHAAQMNLDYAMKLHLQKDYANAQSYYERIVGEENVSKNLKSTAQVYLEQAKSKQELTTPKDYLKQIKNSKSVSSAWSLSQKFKTNFPNDPLLSEAMDVAAEMNLQYAVKLHRNGEYSKAIEYYDRINSEKLVSSSIRNLSKTFNSLAKQGKKISSANDYASKITTSKSVSTAWNLAQEALLIYPNHSALINALNKTANDNLSYGRKLHRQGKSELARPYYEKVNNDQRVDSQIRHLAEIFMGQTNSNHKSVVYIDSGHGGTDSGASFYGAYEKKLNLSVGKYLKNELEKKGYTVIMSRETDTFVPLTDRALEANKLGADIFISLHHNSMGGSGTGKGIETFLFHKVASGFGQETNKNNFKLNDPRISESLNLAENVHSNLIKSTGMYDRGVKGNNFNVLRNTHIPAVLVELGFIDNRNELAIIKSTSFQKNAASAMANGIDKYFASISK